MKSILLVDDNELVLRSLSRLLGHDFDITRCPSVEDALGLVASKHRFDVVLCDMHFASGASGRHFYERALALAPELGDRILIMSGSELEPNDPLSRRFVAKTLPLDELRERIDQLGAPTWRPDKLAE